MTTEKRIGRLHVITDEMVQDRFTHVEIAERAIAGGADTIQFRDKSKTTSELAAAARAIREVCASRGVPLIVNDRTDIAMAVDADGVHLGRSDLPVRAARELLGPGKIIGGTAGSLEEAIEAQRDGADYVGFGHIYPTASKHKPGEAKGPGSLVDICRAVSIPVIAIGGIGTGNFGPVIDAGAWGIAVIGAVCAAEDPAAAASVLIDGIGKRIRRRSTDR
jgi:thiamine-phosphate pyrophosphorylase